MENGILGCSYLLRPFLSRPKRWGIFLSVLALVLSMGSVTLAGNPHSFTDNTSACAQCHSTHAGQAASLIIVSAAYSSAYAPNPNMTYKLCVYCHQGTVPQSKYDVVDGQIITGDASNNVWAASGGGVEKIPKTEGPASSIPAADIVPVTSMHNVYEPDQTKVSLPGNNQDANAKIELFCSNCHNPHGTSNSRMLRSKFTRLNTDNGTWTTINVTGVTITLTNPLGNEVPAYNNAISDFCAACHVDYLASTSGSGSLTSGTYDSKYRHRVAKSGVSSPISAASGFDAAKLVLPTSTDGDLICTTCHNAHGTASVVSSGSSSLLKMDERGICQNCHNKSKNDTVPTFADRDAGLAGIQATLVDPTHVLVSFSAYVQKTAAETASNYSITGPAGVSLNSAALQPDGKTVMLTTSSAITAIGLYTVKVITSNILDTNGNATVANGPQAVFEKQ